MGGPRFHPGLQNGKSIQNFKIFPVLQEIHRHFVYHPVE